MAVLGGVLGALAGGLIGHYAYDKKSSKENTSKKYNYKQSRGVFVKVENASVVPNAVKTGERIDLRMTYAVLGAKPDSELSVTETREIKYKGELFAKPKMYVKRDDGTYSSSIPITIPADREKGEIYRALHGFFTECKRFQRNVIHSEIGFRKEITTSLIPRKKGGKSRPFCWFCFTSHACSSGSALAGNAFTLSVQHLLMT